VVDSVQRYVPPEDLLVVGGDLNTDGTSEAALSILAEVVSLSPRPADGTGNPNTNSGRSKPYDWLLADPDLTLLQVSTVVGESMFWTGLVFDSRVYSPLSEVSPVRSDDSGAENMQHMPVVKDFVLPLE
jgi:hypothetical protein